MKRTLAILIAAAILCSMTACTKEAGNPQEPTGTTLEISLTHSYRAQEILADETLGWTHF